MQNKWCLIVDDEPDICDLVSECIKEQGYKTVNANDGQEALFKMEKQKFNLVITDLKMPKMTGVELIEMIRGKRKKKKDQEHYTFPIIVMTGNLQDFKSEMALFDDLHILEKPFNDEDLIDVLEHLDSDTPIQKLKGTDPDSLFKAALQKLSDSVGIVCKQKADVGKTEAFYSPYALQSGVIISYFLKINGDAYNMHLGLTDGWAKQAAQALSGGEEELPEHRILHVIRQLASAIVNKVIKAFNQRQIATEMIDQTMFYNFQHEVHTRIDGSMRIFQTPIKTHYGDLHFYFSHPIQVEN